MPGGGKPFIIDLKPSGRVPIPLLKVHNYGEKITLRCAGITTIFSANTTVFSLLPLSLSQRGFLLPSSLA